MTGSPGVPRFVVYLLIAEALKRNSKVELYMITSPKTLATISREGKYPEWNFQENNEPYPAELAKQHVLYHQQRLKNKK